MEQTLVLVKPDGVQRALAGAIISRLEARGLRIVAMKMLQISRDMAMRHYGVHQGKPFFEGLVNFITSGPVVAMVLEGRSAVEMVRNTVGSTNPLQAQPGTIRGDLGLDIGRNLVHASDSQETAAQEIGFFFSPDEILNYCRDVDKWVTES
ncbi:nucleoside-diphosphate kinase [SAR202 cluster bacterium AC-647-N09_OGT_505m]|nr:nucleoside-diphosphate kinase [SAR202 cluster bacterium AC-647-N09_OGT_505m]